MKKIIHIDADCFFAAVETRENPCLQGLPMAVGGAPEARGVIATCNYEARKFGVRSAMASATAIKHCPNLLILPPRMALYRQYSTVMQGIFQEYTALVEPLSLDEAYLDVSDSKKCRGSGTLIAKEIKSRIRGELGITVSAGVAPVKFLAKIASEWRKPDGLFVIQPREVGAFVAALETRRLPGVGPVFDKKLRQQGIVTCGHIQRLGKHAMVENFGAWGLRLYAMACGEDTRVVETSRSRKSLSVEHTLDHDIDRIEALSDLPRELLAELTRRWQGIQCDYAVKGAFVKVKFRDFSTTTLEHSGDDPSVFPLARFEQMLREAWQRKGIPLRLIGLGYRLGERGSPQLSLPLIGAPTEEEG